MFIWFILYKYLILLYHFCKINDFAPKKCLEKKLSWQGGTDETGYEIIHLPITHDETCNKLKKKMYSRDDLYKKRHNRHAIYKNKCCGIRKIHVVISSESLLVAEQPHWSTHLSLHLLKKMPPPLVSGYPFLNGRPVSVNTNTVSLRDLIDWWTALAIIWLLRRMSAV